MKPELEAVLTGVGLLSPAEQEEFFTRARDMDAELSKARLNTIATKAPLAHVDKRVGTFVQLRDLRAANTRQYESVDKAYKDTLESIERSLIATAQEQGVEGFRTEFGTAYMETKMLASVADETVFYEFVRTTGDLDFFERRIKASHVKEYAEANGGAQPPGLNIFRELTMKVRRK